MGFDLTGLGSLADLATSLVNRFLPPSATEAEKLAATTQVQQMLETREMAVLDAQKAIVTAEMAQGDNYTKRARPTIVYAGLVAIFLVHVFLPITAWITLLATSRPLANMPAIALPEQFWATWGGVCGIWIIGRSVERAGASNKLVRMITGKGGDR